MNTIATNLNQGSKKPARKIHSLTVDMTPMVDLGFLLITFFVFTTTASQAVEMQIITPAESLDHTPFANSKTLTVIPVDHDKIVYYHGDLAIAQAQGLYGEPVKRVH